MQPTALEDLQLVRRLLAGDEAAFDAFFATYFPRLTRYALSRVQGNESLAEEAVQNALCKAVAHLSGYRGEAALLTWLMTFCRHEIHALLGAGQAKAISLSENLPAVDAALEALALAAASPEDDARRKDTHRLVHLALDWLSPRHAQVLTWKYLEELSVATIAERLALSEKAAESLLTRARGYFREAFLELAGEGELA